ncbi:MAG: polysaccharide deacetylase family protein [Treponema sp.]|nr:polysaccharide deacetylase family protein [Treponema sp.]
MMQLRTARIAIALLFAAFPLAAGISFDNADLNSNDEMLFTVRQNLPGTVSYQSLFYTKLANGAPVETPRVVTCYPERMELLSGGRVLRIRNRYGTAQYVPAKKTLEYVQRTDTIPQNSMRLFPCSTSPDGTWNCFVQKTGFAEGALVIENAATGKTATLDMHAPFSYDAVPVKWSPDGSLVLYSKNGMVYFCSPDAVMRGVESSESYREIGQGTIASVCWAGSDVFYIDGDIIYKINVKELYATGLYADVIGKGALQGRLPELFDAQRDMFSVNKTGTSLLLIKSGKVFSYYVLKHNSSEYVSVVFSRPYVNAHGSLLDAVVLWSTGGEPFVWMRIIPYAGGKTQAAVYRITNTFTPVLTVEDSCRPILCADGTHAAFFSGSTVYVYNVSAWKCIGELNGETMVSAVWSGNNTLYVGGSKSVRKWDIASGAVETLFLSSADSCAWSGTTAVVSSGGKAFLLDKTLTVWAEASSAANGASHQNGRYRVFLGTTPNPRFENALYVRTLAGKAVTKPVFPESVKKEAARKKVALAFDAYNSADGLPAILATLDAYNIRGTFFLNGEFIKRYPNETKQIAASGNACASLFFSTLDLTGTAFIVDESFIRRGLARNEDEFYHCTGKELSLLWHAPYYRATDVTRSFGEKAGYAYVDAVNGGKGETAVETAATHVESATRIIEAHLASLAKNGGGVVPVTVGFAQSARTDYVHQNLDLLVSAILDSGFDIVDAEAISN